MRTGREGTAGTGTELVTEREAKKTFGISGLT